MCCIEEMLKSIEQYAETVLRVTKEYPVHTCVLAIIICIILMVLHKMIVDKYLFKEVWGSFVLILPLIIPCIDFYFPEPDSPVRKIVIPVILFEVIVVIVCNTRYYREQKKNSVILSIQNANSRKKSESVIDSAVAKVGDYLFCHEYYICDSVFNALRQDAFREQINQVVDQMINYLSDAYEKSEDRIGVNIWVRKKMWNPYDKKSEDRSQGNMATIDDQGEPQSIGKQEEKKKIMKIARGIVGKIVKNAKKEKDVPIKESDSQSGWYVVYRRNTNEDPPIARIVAEKGTTFGEVKDYPGMVIFMDKEKATKLKLYFEPSKKAIIKALDRKTKGSIFCQNISISLDNCDKVIGVVVSVTSYKESLCKKTEREEIQRYLECFGLEVKSIVAKHLLSHPNAKKSSGKRTPPCGRESPFSCSEKVAELYCRMSENDD